MKLRIDFRATAYFISRYPRTRAHSISEADILSPVDVIRLIPLSGGIEVRVETNNVTAASRARCTWRDNAWRRETAAPEIHFRADADV